MLLEGKTVSRAGFRIVLGLLAQCSRLPPIRGRGTGGHGALRFENKKICPFCYSIVNNFILCCNVKYTFVALNKYTVMTF